MNAPLRRLFPAGSAAAVVLAGGLAALVGCKTMSDWAEAAVRRNQAHVVLGRFVATLTDTQQWATARADIERRAPDAEEELIAHRLKLIKRESAAGPRRIPALESAIAELKSEYRLNLPAAEFSRQAQTLVQDAALRSTAAAWFEKNAAIRIDRWDSDEGVLRFAKSLQDEVAKMNAAIRQALAESEALTAKEQYGESVRRLFAVVRYDPERLELVAGFKSALKGMVGLAKGLAEQNRYLELLDTCRGWRALGDQLGAQEKDKVSSWDRELAKTAGDICWAHLPEGVDFYLNLADKQAVLGRHLGMALVLCRMAADHVDFAEQASEGASARNAGPYRAEINRALTGYRDEAALRLRRNIVVREFSSPSPAARTDSLRSRLQEEISSALGRMPPSVWGVRLADPGVKAGSAQDYIVTVTLGTAEVKPPDLMRDEMVTSLTIHAPESIGGDLKQKIVQHAVRRKTYRQTGKVAGSVVISLGKLSEQVNVLAEASHEYVQESEDAGLSRAHYEVVGGTPRDAMEYQPVNGQPVNEEDLWQPLLAQSFAGVPDRLLAMVSRYSKDVERSAVDLEKAGRWDEAADTWAKLAEHNRRATEAAKDRAAKDLDVARRRAEEKAAAAAVRWLAARGKNGS